MLGTGKSIFVRTRFPTIYEKQIDKWFDGYDGTSSILLDDFAGDESMIDIGTLIRLADCGRMDVQIKGASLRCRAPFIFITSNIPIKDWYPKLSNTVRLRALQRRIDAVLTFQYTTHRSISTIHIDYFDVEDSDSLPLPVRSRSHFFNKKEAHRAFSQASNLRSYSTAYELFESDGSVSPPRSIHCHDLEDPPEQYPQRLASITNANRDLILPDPASLPDLLTQPVHPFLPKRPRRS